MRWLLRFAGTPFGLAVLGCLMLAGWALWSGGALDGPIARDVRTSSVYAAPGVAVDERAAEQVIGNRRLVVVFLAAGADLREGCDDVRRAADGTVVLVLRPEEDQDGYDTYGCALLPDRDGENFGRAAVAEMVVGRGIDEFADRPVEAVKVIAVNYDFLVRAGTVPDGSRTISPSLPRYLVAAAAVLAVLVGAAVTWLYGRRVGRRAAARAADRQELADSRSRLSAATAVLAQRIIDLDRRYATVERAVARTNQRRDFLRRYRELTLDYTELLPRIVAADERGQPDVDQLITEVKALTVRSDRLAARSPAVPGD
ncbi:hypothetical protein O7632_13145 [Solwaraspora sp. WMMD406]|uniref:hypothetical protein n=1 Tax=Solwaraspora sp. WMMD406 TaxID=3016095 RepID=UPI002416A1F9|nr:hypothetical protein [Solwaraspora sp. WMMD406]MDG4765037.1 hypothetical protein [Solwaraspora sp. WMMD406]